MGRLHALLVLTWGLIRSLAAPLLGTRRGLAEFRRSYAADRLAPMSAGERRILPAFSACIACGLCGGGEGAAVGRAGGPRRGALVRGRRRRAPRRARSAVPGPRADAPDRGVRAVEGRRGRRERRRRGPLGERGRARERAGAEPALSPR